MRARLDHSFGPAGVSKTTAARGERLNRGTILRRYVGGLLKRRELRDTMRALGYSEADIRDEESRVARTGAGPRGVGPEPRDRGQEVQG
jgi:hypothetical protein